MIRGGVGEENVGREGKERGRKTSYYISVHMSRQRRGRDWETTSAGLQMAGSPPVVSAPSAVAVGLKEMSWRQGKFAKSKLGPLLS